MRAYERITQWLVGRDGELVSVWWDEVMDRAGARRAHNAVDNVLVLINLALLRDGHVGRYGSGARVRPGNGFAGCRWG